MSEAVQEGVKLSLWDERPYVFVNGDPPAKVLDQLEEELSYEVPDAQYTDAWRDGTWDGRHRLFRKSRNGNWYFPVGLLERVQEVLDVYGVGYEVEGLVRPGKGDLGLSWNTDMVLRDYQQEAVSECLQYGSGVVVMPTGAGKTLVGIYLAHTISRPTLVLCHRKEIADQWVEKMEEILDVDVARCYGGTRENGDVMVALYQSVYQDGEVRDGVRLDHDVALFDEAHRVGADTFEEVALSASALYRFGFSATPEREDNATLRVIGGTGPMIADLSVEKLIDEGYLAEPEWEVYEAPSAGGRYPTWQEEYKAEIVENMRRNKMISQVVDSLEKPCLVTVERINHGERLEALIDGTAFVHGDSSDRDEMIQKFADGDLPVMISTLLGEGFDLPSMASLVVAGGLKSSTSMIQQVGRALRPETETATVVDFLDRGQWIGRHSEERIKTYQEYYGSYGP